MVNLKLYLKIAGILLGVIGLGILVFSHPYLSGMILLGCGIWFVAELFVPKN